VGPPSLDAIVTPRYATGYAQFSRPRSRPPANFWSHTSTGSRVHTATGTKWKYVGIPDRLAQTTLFSRAAAMRLLTTSAEATCLKGYCTAFTILVTGISLSGLTPKGVGLPLTSSFGVESSTWSSSLASTRVPGSA